MSIETQDIEGKIICKSLCGATEIATQIFIDVANEGIRVSLDHLPHKKCFRLYGVSQCNQIKTIAPEFELKRDQRLTPYAELYVTYE